MNTSNLEWDRIFSKEGRVFLEPIPQFDAIAAEFSRAHCTRVLDLGCGTGRHSVAFAARGFDVTATDISMNGLAQTRSWLAEVGKTAPLACVDTRDALPFPSACFDAVFTNRVIHHALLARVRLAISEIHRLLRPHGLAYISLPGRNKEDIGGVQIEPGTFIPQDGSEKGLPHHLFTQDELYVEFSAFKIRQVEVLEQNYGYAILLEKE
ncbi:MAG: class I SAM-dependent methyltransferase [Anaerolineaceae bacterium]|nr:class I SAM-dependent methyltransferase [Anaerolineaceae bacterium]